MSSSESDNQAAFAVLQAELTRLREGAMEAWHGFLNFFTWGLTTQSVVMGLLMTHKSELDARYLIVLTGSLAALDILGVLAGLRISSFTRLQGKLADEICRVMTARAETSGLNVNLTSGFSGEYVSFYAKLCVGALSVTAAGWAWLLYYTVRHNHATFARVINAAVAAVF
ncbi:MAG: hypothetical protein JO093_17960 [Acidobacteria bacterium]|nr:hypothetical protein [Acidobacteriota bacterium]MBV9069063.1 hypothetical protein [Acidobacteriota bacterium]MBV9187507.1 hypothetical protein [Acidobacteriota bacterium]